MSIKIGGKTISVTLPTELYIPPAKMTSLEIKPTTSDQTFVPTSPYVGYKEVVLEKVTSEIDSNIKSENIKSGVSILGVEGSFSGGGSYDASGFLNKTLSEFTIPSNVPVLYNHTFSDYPNALTLTAGSTLLEIEPHAFSGSNVTLEYKGESLTYGAMIRVESHVSYENCTTTSSQSNLYIDGRYVSTLISFDYETLPTILLSFTQGVLTYDIFDGRLSQTLTIPNTGEVVDFALSVHSVPVTDPIRQVWYLTSVDDIPDGYYDVLKGRLRYNTEIGCVEFVEVEERSFVMTEYNFFLPEYFTNRGWFAQLSTDSTRLNNFDKLSTSGTVYLYNKDYISQKVTYSLHKQTDTVACFPLEESGYKFEVETDLGGVIPEISYESAVFTDTNYVNVRENTLCKFLINEQGYTRVSGERIVGQNTRLTIQMTPTESEVVSLSGDFVSDYSADLLATDGFSVVDGELKLYIESDKTYVSKTGYINFTVPNDGNSHTISVTLRTVAGGDYSGCVVCCSKEKQVLEHNHFVGVAETLDGTVVSIEPKTDTDYTTYSLNLTEGEYWLMIGCTKWSSAYESMQIYISNITFTAEKPYTGTITEEVS